MCLIFIATPSGNSEDNVSVNVTYWLKFVPTLMYAVGSKSLRPDIQKPRQMENAVRDIQCHLWWGYCISWKVCWNRGRLCWKIAKLFYFCHLKKLVRPETFGPYYVHHISTLPCREIKEWSQLTSIFYLHLSWHRHSNQKNSVHLPVKERVLLIY